MIEKRKAFDCVRMKRAGALRVHETLKGKSLEEKVAFWRAKYDLALAGVNRAKASRHGRGR